MPRALAAWLGGYVVVVVAMLAVAHGTPALAGLGEVDPGGVPVRATLQQVFGLNVRTDLLVDYASASALRDRSDPYAPAGRLVESVGGPAWRIEGANPHPPTMISLVLPLTLLPYRDALVVWSVGMIVLLAASVRLAGVRWPFAVTAGVVIACLWPGALGIGNPAPLIVFGVALAHRCRASPWLAGAGLFLATAPKLSGAVVGLAVLLAGGRRAVGVGLGALLAAALVPLAFYPSTWARYLDAGRAAIAFNADRDDNAALLHTAERLGVPVLVTGALVIVCAGLVAFRTRDAYWPATWLSVAILPIAWAYSLLTLLPACLEVARRRQRVPIVLVTVAGLLACGPPLGRYGVAVFPVICLLVLLALARGTGDGKRLPATAADAAAAPGPGRGGC